jgi:hypothetical protein
MLEKFGPKIWISDGPTVTAAAGFHYPTRMAIIALQNKELLIWSPIMLTPELRAAIDALGSVRYLIPPNSLHDSFLSAWQDAYPKAAVFAPPGLRENRPDIAFSFDISDIPALSWADEIDIVIVPGNKITTEAVLFHRNSKTAIFADLLQQFPSGWFKGWRALIARLDLMVTDKPTVPRKFRLAFTNRRVAQTAVQQILAWPTEKVLIAHGAPVTQNGQVFLKQAFRWLIAA